MDNSFYLKNGSVLWNGAFTPLDMAVEDGHITALSRGHHNEKGLRWTPPDCGCCPVFWTCTPTAPPGWT